MSQKASSLRKWIKTILFAAVLAFIIRFFLLAPIVVDGPSMLPTLKNGDYLIVNRLSYIVGEPERFDIVVFRATKETDYIKRIIGLPGEHIEYKDGNLYVNGNIVKEPYVEQSRISEQQYFYFTRDFSLPDLPGNYREIPEDYVLVLGDNRPNSTDSRILGLIPLDQLVGEAHFIYWPFKRIGTVN
ncbi:signal peptidase I [Salirhabdus salicampi]|uniref:signal peptidase I n=1 Tax=Salirhabdus salicampi TaxID=476102 RepID=UPI0020C5217A|nr:signal peptidase I [Salirhabdus salicampi]MCP8616541.1 signal peptidase I [Salirhabdus salicampi]